MGDITEKVDIVINESGGRTVKRSLDDIADSAQRGVQPVNNLNASLGSGARAADVFFGSLKAIGGILATLKLTSLINEAATLSQRYNELGIVLDVVGRNAGLLKSEVDATTEAVRKQGISMIESRQIVTRMIQSQIDLSKATELARLAQDAAVIGQINSSEALDRLVFGITSAQVEVLRGIGINVSFEQSYAKLAKEMGVTQNALTEQQKLQARLNVVLGEASKISGVYEGAMANAGKQMRSTERLVEDLKVKIGGLFDQTSIFAVTAYTNALKEADSSVENFTQTGQLKAWGDSVARIAAFAADSVRSVGIVFDITGKAIGAMAAQAVAVSKFDFGTAIRIQGDFNKDFDSAVASMSKMRDLVESQITERDLLTKATERETMSLKSNSVELGKNTEGAKKDIDARNRFIQALQTEVDSIVLNEFAIKRMEAAKLGAIKAASPLIDALEAENKRLNLQSIQVNQITSDLNKYKQVTESVKTEQEKFADTVEELNRLRNLTNGAAISQETYNRALKKAQEEFKKTGATGKSTLSDLDQYTIQAARNIQTSFANFLFDPFDDGLKGMLNAFINTIRRMVAEIASAKILEALGVSSLLGSGGSVSGTGSGGTVGILSSLASMFSGVRTAGVNTSTSAGVFGGGSSAGTAFIGGPGTAIGGTTSGRSGFGMNTSSLMSLGAAAGPYGMAAAAAFMVLSALEKKVGDYKLSGGAKFALGAYETFSPMAYAVKGLGLQTPEALIGKFLFGRGPYKFRQQSIQGDIASTGLDGTITDVYRSKGAVFTGNRHKSFESDIPSEIIRDIDKTIKNIYKSTHQFALNLGMDANLVDTFTKEIQIKSEKGKTLTTEAVGEMLSGLNDEIVARLMPNIDDFKLTGETAGQTFTRLNSEFEALNSAAIDLGASVGYAKQLVSGMSIEARMAFIDLAGGAENLKQLTSYFAENYLTPTERIAPMIEQLTAAAKDLGFAYTTDVTKEQVKALIQSDHITAETRLGLLGLLRTFDNVRDTLDAMSFATGGAADAIGNLSSVIAGFGNDLNAAYQSQKSAIESNISRFKDLAGQLRSSRESLALGALSPLTPGQRLDEARNQFNQTRLAAASGDQNALAKLPSIAQSFLEASQVYNASGAAYLSDFGMVNDVLKNAEASALSQIDIATNQLTALDESVKNLIEIKDTTKTVADLIRDLNIAVLTSKGNPGISTSDIQGYLAAHPGMSPQEVANVATSRGVSLDQLAAAGYDTSNIIRLANAANVTDQQIKSFVDANISNPMAIYNAAIQNGISSTRLSSASGLALADIQDFVRKNNLPSFAKGTDFISRSGLAMVHRAEAIVPSSTTEEIKKLREELAKLREEQNRQTGDMIKVTDITNRQNAQAIAKALADAERTRQWSDRSKAALA
ncbi:hypothetical protein R2083_08060 [Nitrosomonas sp. Is35]|uniref:hypothetical protein n=1 Tax=Nitrosomonas sp. Is35 TaxID=3080534 RepID=UPI00294B4593|nr:hypothetical protein [Nitrosomonas sp. Is35]MDV6347467.1 hypothetical protein [Nitrosomonas sp. Is35]